MSDLLCAVVHVIYTPGAGDEAAEHLENDHFCASCFVLVSRLSGFDGFVYARDISMSDLLCADVHVVYRPEVVIETAEEVEDSGIKGVGLILGKSGR